MSDDTELQERLLAAFDKVRRNIKRVRSRNERIGEAQTKTSLIDPVLRALGWDTTDMDEVSLEYKHTPKDNPVDYALFLQRTPRLFVEAKALDTNLDDRKWKSQVVNYANTAGVEWCVLTDGDNYCIYNSHAPVDVDQKLFRDVRVSDGSQQESVLDTLALLSRRKLSEDLLSALWKSYFIDRKVQAALKQIMEEQDGSLVRLIRKKTAELSPSEIKQSLHRSHIVVDYPETPVPTGQSERTNSGTPDAKAAAKSSKPGPGQSFKWLLDMRDDGSFSLDCRYLPDESRSFQVTGKQVAVGDDFKPARTKLLQDIYEQVKPIFPTLPDNLVRAKAWSGVHKVYPADVYGR